MRTDLTKSDVSTLPRRRALALLGGGALGVAVAQGQGSAVASSRHRGAPLVGTWDLTVRFPDGLENPTLIQFSSSGSLVETNALTRSTGLGEWRRESVKRYSYRFWEHIFDSDGTLTNFVRVAHEVSLERSGDTFTGSGVGLVYDLDRNLVQTVDTSLQARRLP